MALETSTYIDGLVASNPLGADALADADGHIRLIKSTIKATFPNITGAVTATQGQLNVAFPLGGIVLWSGSIATIPSGWLLCDGNSGTPNLTDRFIVGAGAGYAVGATGGSAQVVLTTAQLPSHTHSISGSVDANGSHSHGVTDAGHSHSVTAWLGAASPGSGGGADAGQRLSSNTTVGTSVSGTGISIVAGGVHSHTFSGTSGATGSASGHENRPPYYALAYIMKV